MDSRIKRNYRSRKSKKITVEHTMVYQKTHCVFFYLFFLDSKKGEDNMRKFIVGRLLSIIPVLIIVSVVIFSVVHLTPGDPAASILGDEATVEDIAALRAKMGLDKPVVEQYFVWIYICTFSQVPIPSLKLYFGPNYAGWNDDETLQSLLNDMNTSTNMDDAKAAWEKVQEYSWDYLAVINFGHYIANYAWNDHVKGLNNYSGLYFWNAGYVE